MARGAEAKFSVMDMHIRVGRYYFVDKTDTKLIARLQSIARHVYAVKVINGEQFVCSYEFTPNPDKVMITDKFIPLTSSHDMMAWHIITDDLLFMKDKSIIV